MIRDQINLTQNLDDWAVLVDEATASEFQSRAGKGGIRVRAIELTNGERFIPASVLNDENGVYLSVFNGLTTAQWKCVRREIIKGLAVVDEEYSQLPEWRQISSAGAGPQGAEDGWPVGAQVTKDGHVWASRVSNNVNEPLVDATSTWSRKDGTFVVPAGWEYQPGEEVTEDGGATWFRVEQATSFAPSASPSQYVKIDGPGGDPLPQTDEWAAGVPYAVDDAVTYQGSSYTCLQAHTSQVGWEPPNVPALWSEQ